MIVPHRKSLISAVVLAGFLSCFSLEPLAAETVNVNGVVRNIEADAPVEGAIVQIQGPALAPLRENARMQTTTNRSGQYRFRVPAGQYHVSVSSSGFLDSPRTELDVAEGETVVHDFDISPTAVSSAYHVEDVPLPQQMSPEISGVDFTPGGQIVVCNRLGEVWVGDLDRQLWHRFAHGLYEPFGVTAESEDVIYVLQRPEITRLSDTTGDGMADRYETVNDSWGVTGNYHEFSYGLRRDSQGNFYGGLGMASVGEFTKARGPLRPERVIPWDRPERLTDHHRSVAKYQGWVFQVTGEGEFVPWASGFRQPLGVAVSPNDEVFVTDVAGSWVPSSSLAHARRGHFYGHPDGLKWDPTLAGQELSPELLAVLRTPPAVVLTHGRLGTSPGEPVWDTTEGKFGPFSEQMFIGDVTRLMMRVDLEQVAGEYQGAAFPFIRERGLRQGSMRNQFGPDGHLYLGQTIRGWREDEEGLQRIVWTGENPVEIRTMRLTDDGFLLTFTQPMDSATLAVKENYQVARFQYNYHILDGSLRINEAPVPVVDVQADSSGVRVELVLEELRPGYVYELLVPDLRSENNQPLDNPTAYYTANRLLSGERFTGLPIEQKMDLEIEDRPPDPLVGARIYHVYCAPCHRPDGAGSPEIRSASFVAEDTPLQKSDDELIQFIIEGTPLEQQDAPVFDEETGRFTNPENPEEGVMPAFGQALTLQEIRDVLAFIREEFSE